MPLMFCSERSAFIEHADGTLHVTRHYALLKSEQFREFEGELRRRIGELEEAAQFSGGDDKRFTLGLVLSPPLEEEL